MRQTLLALAGITCSLLPAAYAFETIPSGTSIAIRTNDRIRGNSADGQVFGGTVANDVADRDGRVIIRAGSNAELQVRRFNNNEIGIDLDSITVEGRRYSVDASEDLRSQRQGVGANKRTGEFVGGGAVLGTLLGAIAGGGRGAAIGALAGGGAGAGTQILTRGGSINIPAETVLTFRMERPLTIQEDRGYERDGRHYHRDQYDNRDRQYQAPPRQ